MPKTKIFTEAYAEIRELIFEAIDFYIEAWHESDDPESICDYLGLTEEEYSDWVMNPNKLILILEEKIRKEREIN